MTAPEHDDRDQQGGGLTDVEAACLEGLIETPHGWRYRPSVGAAAVERIVAAREQAAADRARAEVTAAIRALADEWQNRDHWTIHRFVAAQRLRALASSAPTPRCAETGDALDGMTCTMLDGRHTHSPTPRREAGWRCEFCTIEAQRECGDAACAAIADQDGAS